MQELWSISPKKTVVRSDSGDVDSSIDIGYKNLITGRNIGNGVLAHMNFQNSMWILTFYNISRIFC